MCSLTVSKGVEVRPLEQREADQYEWGVWRLYVFYTALGERLYVGITSRTYQERWDEHRMGTESRFWYAKIDHSLTETRELNNGRLTRRFEAERDEKFEIKKFDRVRGVQGTLANNKHNANRGKRYVHDLKVQAGAVPSSRVGQVVPGARLLSLMNDFLPLVALLFVLVLAALILML